MFHTASGLRPAVRLLRLTIRLARRIFKVPLLNGSFMEAKPDRERVVRNATSGLHNDKESVMHKRNGPELVDCGRVSRRTRGVAFQLLYENVNPPYDRIFLHWP